MRDPFVTFAALLAYIQEREKQVNGPANLEPEFSKMLQFLMRYPDLRPRVVDAFAKALRDKTYGRYMVIQYCMHKLRWPEMLAEAKEAYTEAQNALIKQQLHGSASQHLSFVEEVIGSFEDTWSSRPLFAAYRS